MKKYFLFFILVLCSIIFYVIQKEIKYNQTDNHINLKLTSDNKFYIDEVWTNISEIQTACSYEGCRGSEPIINLYLNESISMLLLDSIENELIKADVLRVNYHKL